MRRLYRNLVAVVTLCGLGLASSVVWAGSPTDLAENYAEAKAYQYAYITKVMTEGAFNATLADSSSTDEEIQLAFEAKFWAAEAFSRALVSLKEDDDTQWYWVWARCLSSRAASEDLYEMTGKSMFNSNAWYAGLAADYALDAYEMSLPRNMPLPSGK